MEEKIRVLVADDERLIADSVCMILEASGYDSKPAYSGRDAVDKAATYKPDILLSDVVMPELNGIEAAIAIREFLPECGVVLFSGQAATADLIESFRTHGIPFQLLAKPIHPKMLLEHLKMCRANAA